MVKLIFSLFQKLIECIWNLGEGNGTPLQYSCLKIPWTEEPGRLQTMGSQESDTSGQLHFHFSLSCIGEGNGNPLQCSCLENPRDGGAWWAAVYGVTQSRTQLKRLSSSSSIWNLEIGNRTSFLIYWLCIYRTLVFEWSNTKDEYRMNLATETKGWISKVN